MRHEDPPIRVETETYAIRRGSGFEPELRITASDGRFVSFISLPVWISEDRLAGYREDVIGHVKRQRDAHNKASQPVTDKPIQLAKDDD